MKKFVLSAALLFSALAGNARRHFIPFGHGEAGF